MKTIILTLVISFFSASTFAGPNEPTKPVGPPVPGPGPIPVPGPCKRVPLPGEPCRN